MLVINCIEHKARVKNLGVVPFYQIKQKHDADLDMCSSSVTKFLPQEGPCWLQIYPEVQDSDGEAACSSVAEQ